MDKIQFLGQDEIISGEDWDKIIISDRDSEKKN